MRARAPGNVRFVVPRRSGRRHYRMVLIAFIESVVGAFDEYFCPFDQAGCE
jgi:hypothetical protein